MKKERVLKPGEMHHWWPQGVSKYWTNDRGRIHRIDTDGRISESAPIKTAKISDGHNFIVQKGELSGWDQTFEHLFDVADSNFPSTVEWLQSLVEKHGPTEGLGGYGAPVCDPGRLEQLIQCLVSLAVRSPKTREASVGLALRLRSHISDEEQHLILSANLMQSSFLATRQIRWDGKFAVYFSRDREFIFGDGFYQYISTSSLDSTFSRILAPITPQIAVLYVSPMEYMPDPPLVTLEAHQELVELINHSVQVYSKNWLFYRFEMPDLNDAFLTNEHLRYVSPDPVDSLVSQIPGVLFA